MDPQDYIPADLNTPVSAFLKLGPLRPRFLLESVVGGTEMRRYSFLGFGDAIDVVFDGEATRIGDEVLPPAHTGEMFRQQLRLALARAPRLLPELPHVPFRGGLVGQVDYDMVRRFEPVGEHPDYAPRAAFVMPCSVLVFDHVTRRISMVHGGATDERRQLLREVRHLLHQPVPSTPGIAEFTPPAPAFDRDAFFAAVDEVKQLIHAGEVFQLVLSNRFLGTTGLDPFTVYRAIRLTNPSPYMVFMKVGGQALVASSPEALVTLDAEGATLRPIAGTRPRGATEAEDLALEATLLADEKEAAEHVMLVDLARNDLGRVACPGTVTVHPYRSIERYSHVMHIVSGVRGKLRDDLDQFDLFSACFPAGTVSGAPKVRAMQHIDRLEPLPREFYAGTLGYFSVDGTMDQAIAIRSLAFQGDRYCFQAGAGIVADSSPKGEHKEIMAKSAAMRRALQLACEMTRFEQAAHHLATPTEAS